MPDILGSTQSSAKAALEAAGLKMGSVTSQFSEEDAGTVISADYDQGTELSFGTSVNIVISKGPQSDQGSDPAEDGTQTQ